MAKSSSGSTSGSSGGSGGFGLITLGAGLYAFFTIPALTGLKGAFAAAMVGSGTSMVAGLGGLAGGALGAAFGAVTGRSKGARIGAIVGAIAGALAAIPAGYDLAKDVIVNGMDDDSKRRAAIHETIAPREQHATASLPDLTIS